MDRRQAILSDLTSIMCAISGLAAVDVRPDDRLIDMGLDSLMLMKIGQAVEKTYAVELKLSMLFKELPTLAALAAYLAERAQAPAPAPEPTPPPVASASSAPPLSAATPMAAPAGSGSLFSEQLQAMTALAQRSMESLADLTRQQLALLNGAGAPLATAAPHPPAIPIAVSDAPPKLPQPAAAPAPVAPLRGINMAGPRLTDAQRAFVDALVGQYVGRTTRSKALTQASRETLADWKHTLSFWGQLKEAKYPIVVDEAEGARFRDVDGNEYIDIAMGMGVHFFGHKPSFLHQALATASDKGLALGPQSPLTAETAELIRELTGVERVAFSNTGSEAVMIGLRLARAATGRDKVVLFKNSYHGIFDGVLATEVDGVLTTVGLGTPRGMTEDLVVLEYGSDAALDYVRAHGASLAAVLVEPVPSRDPDQQPQAFLKSLRAMTRSCGAALIFDEMINGFRILPGGAQAWFGVDADIVLYGKIVGGGLPIGVIAGKARFLDYIDGGAWDYGDQSGPRSEMIYFGGTFCRNPATMATALAALRHMKASGPELQTAATARTTAFCDRLNYWFQEQRVPLRAKHFSSQWRLTPLADAEQSPIELELLYLEMMVRGVYTWERRISFFSAAHTDQDCDEVFRVITESVEAIRAGGFAWSVEVYPARFRPLASAQRRLYALIAQGAELAYHLPQAYRVDGPLDVDRLEAAFHAVIRRHEALRSAVVVIDGEPVIKRLDQPRFAIERLGQVSEPEVEALIAAFVRPFDLATAPLVRVAVAELGPDRRLLLTDAHHIVVDGLSFDVVAAELMALYEGQALPPVAYELESALARADGAAANQADAAFWKAELFDDPAPPLALPTDRDRAGGRDFVGDKVVRSLAPETTRALRALGRRSGASLYMVLLGLWSTLLHRLTGQEDIAIGGVSSGRPDASLAEAVGMFANTVVFRTRPASALPFDAHLAAIVASTLAVYDHQHFPFEQIAALGSAAAAGGNPVFDTMLSYEDATGRAFRTGELSFVPLEAAAPAAMFDLALDVTEADEALTLRFLFAAALFDRGAIEHWADAFEKLVASVLTDPDRPLGGLDMTTPAAEALLARLNDTRAAFPEAATLVSLFADTVAQHPDRPAVAFGETTLTYAELDARSSVLAAAVAARAAAGPFVGLLLPRSELVPIAVLAALKAGCAYVPLDPKAPAALLEHILADSGCAVVLTTRELAAGLADAARGLALDVTAPPAIDAPTTQSRPPRPTDTAYVIYTSGSTGLPKGCPISHRNVVRLLTNSRNPFGFGPADVWLCAHSFAFDFSVWELWGAWTYGGVSVIAAEDQAIDPERLLGLVRRHRVSVLSQTPGAFHGLVAAEQRQPFHDLADHLRMVIFGGDRLEPSQLRAWATFYPPDRIALVNMYGITETTVHVTHHRVAADEVFGPPGRSLIGGPLPDTTVEVRDVAGQPQLIGAPGELWVGGGGVCQGYLNQPALTAQRFVDVGGRRFYRTGDVGRLTAGGMLEYLGRNDRQTQVRGHRVELNGIERRLLQHPGVEKALVLDRAGPDGVVELVAYVVGRDDLTARSLREHLALSLPDYAIPGVFAAVAAFPLTVNGKVDRAALPSADAARLPSGDCFIAARTPAEAAVARIWQEVLEIPEVGVEDNYFLIGGDSIKALQIVARMRRAGLQGTVGQVLAAKTVANLATLISADAPKPDETAAAPPAASVAGGSGGDLTPVQHWLIETYGEVPTHFNNATLLQSPERLDPTALQASITAVETHHAALRLRLDSAAAPSRQLIGTEPAIRLEVVDVDGPAALTAHATAAQGEFAADRAPLMRFILYRLPGGDRLLALCHHLVIDGVSWRILLEDLGAAYRAALAGAPVDLPPASRAWLDWLEVLQEAARSPELLAELPHWAAVETVPVPPLPADFDDPANAVADQRAIGFELGPELTRQLLTGATRRLGVDLRTLLLASLAIACRDIFGVERMRLRLEGHGREELAAGFDVSRTIGWFTTLWPLLLELRADAGSAEAVAAVAEAMARTPRNGVGYGLLRYLTPAAMRPGLAFASDPEVCFNYLGQFADQLGTGLGLAREPVGPLLDPAMRRPARLDVESLVMGGALSVTINYGQRAYARQTMARLADAMQAVLTGLAAGPPEPELATPSPPASTPIRRGPEPVVLPLSPLQEGMLFHALAGEAGAYEQQFACRLAGPLDYERFVKSWAALAARHDALRAAILTPPGEAPRQVIVGERTIPVALEDLSQLDPETQASRLAELMQADRAKSFDLARDPLIRVTVARLGPELTEVFWTNHHIIVDGWSMGILWRDLMAIYGSLVAGEALDLPAAPSIATYSAWLAERDQAEARRYWAERLAGAPAPTPLPGARSADGALPYRPATEAVTFSRDQTQGLTNLARRLQVTLSTLIQGFWAVLLAHYAGVSDVTFGVVASGRPPELDGVEEMVGLFLQPFPMRVSVENGESFAALAARLQRLAIESEPYQHLPLAELQRLGGARQPLFDHVIVFENYPLGAIEARGGLRIEDVRVSERMHYDYSLVVEPGDELTVAFAHNANVFDAAVFAVVEAQLRTLVGAVLLDPEQPLAAIALAPADAAPADTPDLPSPDVLSRFEAQVAARPNAPALEAAPGAVTYASLNERAETLARALAAAGLPDKAPVALCLAHGADHVASLIGVMKAGGVFAPVDPGQPPARLARQLARLQPFAIVTGQDLESVVASAVGGPAPTLLTWGPGGALDGATSPPTPVASERTAPERARAPDDPMYVMFTSGSTGEPKAIVGSYAAVGHFIAWEQAALGADAGIRVSALAPPTFDVSLRDILLPLTAGGVVCIPPPDTRGDGERLADWLERGRVDVVHIVPSIFRLLAKALEASPRAGLRLQHVLFAGEMLMGRDVERARRVLGDGVVLRNLYGPSETTLAKCALLIGDRPLGADQVVPVGQPLPGVGLLIVKGGRLAPVGALGEIHIAPPYRLLGYFNDAQATAEHFAPCPAAWGDFGAAYRTGDIGRRLPDGAVEVTGRLDGQVKVNGVRVELGEIERALRASPEIDEAIAVSHRRPDGDLAIAAYYTERQPVAPAELRRRLAEELPDALMPPFLLRVHAFPLSLNGKIDRRALPPPEALIAERPRFTAPSAGAEARIAAIWAEVLGIDQVGADAPFFEIGGDSLRAIRVITRVNHELGGRLTIASFLKRPTVREMAQDVGRPADNRGRIPAAPAAANYPVTRAQRRLWILDQMGGDPAAYTLSSAYAIDGPLDASRLAASLEALVERHEALRTVFIATDDGLRQRVLASSPFRVEQRDLTDDADPELAARKLAQLHRGHRFDLAQGPLIRASLLELDPARHVLLINVHHIVSDAWSVSVMIDELQALMRGQTLSPLRLQAKDHAVWEAVELASPARAADGAWWRAKLASPPPRLELPFNRPPQDLPSFKGDRVSIELDPAAIDRLRANGRQTGGTLFAGLLAVTAGLLNRYTGQSDMILGTPVACRDDIELDGQVGFYVNTLPLRLLAPGEASLRDIYAHAAATLAEAIDRRGYPFDALVDELDLPRETSRPPLFDVMVVFQDAGQRTFALDGVSISPIGDTAKIAKFPLTFEFVETPEGVTLNLEFSTDLFDRTRVEGIGRRFAMLLAAATADPAAPLSTLELLDTAERERLSGEGPTIAPPQQSTVPGVFETWVRESPAQTAVICRGRELTYAELNAQGDALAAALAERGVVRGDVVATLMARSERLVVAFLAILKAGAIYLPLDPAYPEARLAELLAQASAKLVVTEPEGGAAPPGVPIIDVDARASARRPPAGEIAADDAAYLIFTSGSTGRPKGVLLEHRGAVNLALAQRQGLGIAPRHRILQFAPATFDASVWEMLMALLNGATLVVAPAELIEDPLAFGRYLAEAAVTVATLPPTYLAELSDEAVTPLELLVTAGEAPDHARALRLAGRLTYVNAYGPTETTVCASWRHVDPAVDAVRPIPIGRAIANAELLVLDPSDRPCLPGVKGEICVAGRGLARGYLGDPAQTDARFTPHPLKPGERLYRTGDQGLQDDDGEVLFVGRRDRQVKLRGRRIELDEVEQTLLAGAGVQAAAVVVHDGQLTAYVAPAASLAAAREAAALRLPQAMTPARWVGLAALPLTPHGKVDHSALPAPAAKPRDAVKAAVGDPADPLQALVAETWALVLGHGDFGLDEPFYQVGGDSIRAIQVVSRLREAGHAIDMRGFLAAPTVEGLAARLAAAEASAPDAFANVSTQTARIELSSAALDGLFHGD